MKRFAVVLVLLLSACSRHSDFPPLLPIANPPTPANFAVASADMITYDLDWTVSDLSAVSHFRVYSVIPLLGTFVEDTTPGETSSMSKSIDFGVPLTGIIFGVSTVTNDNIESTIVFGEL